MIRVISSPSISTTGLATLILAMSIEALLSDRRRTSALEGGERGVQGGARPHRRRRLGGIGIVVTSGVDRLALRGDELGVDLRLVPGERLGQRFEARL